MTDRKLLRQALGAIKAARQSHIDFDYKPHEGYMLETIGKLEAALAQPEQWVKLTLDDMPEEHLVDRSFLRGARWAEAKLKERNT